MRSVFFFLWRRAARDGRVLIVKERRICYNLKRRETVATRKGLRLCQVDRKVIKRETGERPVQPPLL